MTTKIVLGQGIKPCGYPIHVSADSLVNFVINECKYKTGLNSCKPSEEEWKRSFYDNTRGIKYDSAFAKCQDYLIKRLGKSVYCNYIDMFPNSFSVFKNNVILRYGLQLPNLIHKQRYGYIDCQYERINIEFKMQLQSDSSLKITYPTNIPDCKGLPDCGFVITKDSAISILKNKGFLNDNSKYYIDTDGINWVVTLAEDSHGQSKSIKVNLQTSVLSSVETRQRID